MRPSIKLVFLTMNPDPEVVAEAFRRGALALGFAFLPSSLASGLVCFHLGSISVWWRRRRSVF
jgi:hypothetical protein